MRVDINKLYNIDDAVEKRLPWGRVFLFLGMAGVGIVGGIVYLIRLVTG